MLGAAFPGTSASAAAKAGAVSGRPAPGAVRIDAAKATGPPAAPRASRCRSQRLGAVRLRDAGVADPRVSQTAVCDTPSRAPSGTRRRVSYPVSDSMSCRRLARVSRPRRRPASRVAAQIFDQVPPARAANARSASVSLAPTSWSIWSRLVKWCSAWGTAGVRARPSRSSTPATTSPMGTNPLELRVYSDNQDENLATIRMRESPPLALGGRA